MHFQCTDHTPESNVQKCICPSQVSVSHHVQSIFIMSLFTHFVNYLSLFIFSLLPPTVQAALLLFPAHIFPDTESFFCGFPVFVMTDPLSKADISETGTPFILYGELYTTYHEVITSVVRKTEAVVEQVYHSMVGDVLIPTSGETSEEISTASCVMLPGVILAGDLNIFRSTKIDGRIMSYILNHIVNGNIARIAQGKSVVHVQASEISKIEISYPDPETQIRIIKVLEAISNRIESCEKELNHLTKMRNSLLQQLFI